MLFRRSILWSVLLGLCLAGALGAYAQQKGGASTCDPALTADDYISRGIDAYNAEDYETAIAETLCAQEADPSNPIVYNNIAFFLSRLGRNDEALETYAEAIRLDPEYRSALVNRGDLYLSLEDYRSAIADYDRAIEGEPSGYAHNRRGIAYFNLNEYEAAELDFDAAFTLEPDEAVYVRNRAAARFQIENYVASAEDFAEAARLDPDWDVPAFGVGDALFAGGRYDEALQAYRDAILRFESSDTVNARLREIAVLRSAALAEFAPTVETGAITAENASRLAALQRIGVGSDHSASLSALDVSAEGRLLTADIDGTIVLWDAAGEVLSTVTADTTVTNAVISPDGSTAAASLIDGRIMIVQDGEIVELLGVNDGGASGMAFTPDGGVLATALFDGSVMIWDTPTETIIGRFFVEEGDDQVNEDSTNPLAIRPDGAVIASVTGDNTIRLWDTQTGDNTLVIEFERTVFSLAFSPDGSQLLAGGFSTVVAFDAATGDRLTNASPTDSVSHLNYSPDGALIVATGPEIPITLIDAATFEIVARIGSAGSLWIAEFTPDGDRLIAGGQAGSGSTSAALVFEPFSASLDINVKSIAPLTADNAADLALVAETPINEVRGVAWSADGSAVYAASANGLFSFTLDGTIGTLTEMPFGTFRADRRPAGLLDQPRRSGRPLDPRLRSGRPVRADRQPKFGRGSTVGRSRRRRSVDGHPHHAKR
ncbi:MAG: tetratricopeptide repeat protein [Chloroflexi bacterium]|nr:tetratricopeptide repeat protein [Chloroflexota bacterium]